VCGPKDRIRTIKNTRRGMVRRGERPGGKEAMRRARRKGQ
jgi:hypothetical protein